MFSDRESTSSLGEWKERKRLTGRVRNSRFVVNYPPEIQAPSNSNSYFMPNYVHFCVSFEKVARESQRDRKPKSQGKPGKSGRRDTKFSLTLWRRITKKRLEMVKFHFFFYLDDDNILFTRERSKKVKIAIIRAKLLSVAIMGPGRGLET